MTNKTALPDEGQSKDAILAQLAAMAENDPDYRTGRTFSLSYYLSEDHERFLAQAGQEFASANGLNPAAFSSLKRMETEIVTAAAKLLNGPKTTTGLMTAGGTESCLLAVKTYRDRARRLRRVTRPEMILPRTAHVAWFKGAEYFDIKVHLLPETPGFTPDTRRLKRMINGNTIMVLGSAPEYPRGLIDPIARMAKIAKAARVPMHVDACVGGFILPFMAMNGIKLPVWDFRNEGVTSISADLHKYGYAAKGASLILYRHMDLFRDQIFVETDWPGGVFASAGLLGTRPGAAYASAWAALQRIGTKGYCDLAAETIETADMLRAGIKAISGLAIIGAPIGPLFAYRATKPRLDIFAVGDLMEAKGWHIDRVQSPDGLHAMVTVRHKAVVDDYLADLRTSVAEVLANPGLAKEGSAATYGMLAHVPLRGLIKLRVRDIFAGLYTPGGGSADLSARPPARGLMGMAERIAQKIAQWRARAERRG